MQGPGTLSGIVDKGSPCPRVKFSTLPSPLREICGTLSPFSVGCFHPAAAFTFIDFFPLCSSAPAAAAAAPFVSSSHLFSLRFSFSFALWTEPPPFLFRFSSFRSFGSRLRFSMLTKPRGTRSPRPGRDRLEYLAEAAAYRAAHALICRL